MVKMFGIVSDCLAEVFDLIFKVFVGAADWRFGLARILQVNDMVLGLDKLMFIFFFPVYVASKLFFELFYLLIIFGIAGWWGRNWGADLSNLLFESFDLLFIDS